MSDHDELIAVARRWERLYSDERAISDAFAEHNKRLRETVAERDTQIAALKAALQQLYDATEFAIVDPLVPDMAGESFWRAVDAFDDARDVAAGLLTDPATELTGANLRDSGMGEAGGVSDGPQ